MPKAIKKKIRKKTAGSEIEVKDRLSEIKNTLKKRQKTVFTYSAIVLTVVLVIAGIFIYKYISDSKSQQLEYEAYKTYHNMYQKKTLSKQEQFQQALDLFKQAYGKKESPKLLLYIASCYYELDRYDDALNTLNEFTKKYADQKDLIPLTYQKMAMIYLKKGNKDEALKMLDTLYKYSGNIYKDFALIETGRILEKEGRKEDAMTKYKELTEKFPESPFSEEAKAKLGIKKEG